MTIGRTEGMRGLFSGLGSTLLRDAPFSGLNLVVYTQTRKMMQDMRAKEGRAMTPFDTFVAGAISGGVATFLTHPPDVLRTRDTAEERQRDVRVRRRGRGRAGAVGRVAAEDRATDAAAGDDVEPVRVRREEPRRGPRCRRERAAGRESFSRLT